MKVTANSVIEGTGVAISAQDPGDRPRAEHRRGKSRHGQIAHEHDDAR